MSDKIIEAAYDCKYHGKNCTPNIVRIINQADRKLPIGYVPNMTKLQTDWQTFIPTNYTPGYYDAAGNYVAQ